LTKWRLEWGSTASRSPGPGSRIETRMNLVTDSKALNKSLIALRTTAAQITQQTTATLHHQQQTSARMVIFLMRLEMLRQLGNPSAQDSNLNFWRARVRLMDPELRNNI
jgi:hypothetical protein